MTHVMKSVGKIVPVILSGGAGSRLWPASRQAMPKQFLRLVGDRTMLQDTVARFASDMFHPPVFICNAAHVEAIREQMSEIETDIGAIIVEPMGRNTAPCAVVAALHAQGLEEDALFLLAPADHHIEKPEAFARAVWAAAPVALEGHLVTFGITPDHPATGFGYIKKGDSLKPGAFEVDKFVEKPDLETAQNFLETGGFYWNSGIFLFDAETLISEMQAHAPDVETAARAAYVSAATEGNLIRLDADAFAGAPSRPVDKAVMEQTELAAVIPCDLGWHDVGSFKALHGLKANGSGLALRGDVRVYDTTNSLIETDGPLVSVVGLDNVAVIVKDGRVLVLNLDQAQDVKEIVTQLKESGETDHL